LLLVREHQQLPNRVRRFGFLMVQQTIQSFSEPLPLISYYWTVPLILDHSYGS
jgi:hypothetical protein